MRLRCLALALAALQLAGCGSPQQSFAIEQAEALEWKLAPSASKFAIIELGSVEVPHSAALRCWPEKHSHLCLVAQRLLETTTISVARYKQLPQAASEIDTSYLPSGYSCSVDRNFSISETIKGEGGPIAMQTISGLGGKSRWSRNLVNGLVDELHEPAAQRWFPCVEVAEALSSGSFRTMGSSLIKRPVI